jgi:hypothetical protein
MRNLAINNRRIGDILHFVNLSLVIDGGYLAAMRRGSLRNGRSGGIIFDDVVPSSSVAATSAATALCRLRSLACISCSSCCSLPCGYRYRTGTQLNRSFWRHPYSNS